MLKNFGTLSEIWNHHLNKAPQKLQSVEYDYYTTDDVDYAESLVSDFCAEQ